MSEWKDILEDVTAFLNAQTFSEAITFERSYLPKERLADMHSKIGVVFPRAVTRQRANRATHEVQRNVAVAIYDKIPAGDTVTGLDEILQVVNEVVSVLEDKRYGDIDLSTDLVANDPVYDYDRFAEHGIFVSIIVITLRGYEDANR